MLDNVPALCQSKTGRHCIESESLCCLWDYWRKMKHWVEFFPFSLSRNDIDETESEILQLLILNFHHLLSYVSTNFRRGDSSTRLQRRGAKLLSCRTRKALDETRLKGEGPTGSLIGERWKKRLGMDLGVFVRAVCGESRTYGNEGGSRLWT